MCEIASVQNQCLKGSYSNMPASKAFSLKGVRTGELFEVVPPLPFEKGKPSAIIAHTVKGKGISFMENQIKWHHGVPAKEQYVTAVEELDKALLAYQ